MLRDRYDPMDLFELVPAHGLTSDPVLMHLDALLDDDVLFQTVKTDLARRFPCSLTEGRPSTPVEVILRLLVVKHLYGWRYDQTECWVSESLVLRQFCRVYAERVPDDTTLLRWANTIWPATLHHLLEHVVARACRRHSTRGRTLRIDSTVVATCIHDPVDSTLLGDGVRVLNRALQRAKHLIQPGGDRARAIFRDRTRSVRTVTRRLITTSRQRGEQVAEDYQRLIDLTEQVVQQARKVQEIVPPGESVSRQIRKTLERFIPRVERVVRQARRRVLEGKQVAAGEKLVSLFEPHTAIIRKGTLGHPVAFGRVLWLDETEGGIVSRYAVLPGTPDDAQQVVPSVEHHIHQFGRAPRLLVGDRTVYSPAGERYAQDHGVYHVVLPQPGKRSHQRRLYEQQRWFQRGRRWRAGIEGRISVLKRRHKLARCLSHGPEGMERWVGWGVLAHNLQKIAQAAG